MSDTQNEAIEAIKTIQEAVQEERATNEQFRKEMEAKGSADVLLSEKLTKLEAEVLDAKEIADKAVLEAKRRDRIVTDANGNAVDMDAKAADWAAKAAHWTNRKNDGWNAERMSEYKAAYTALMRANFDRDMITDDERKALSVGQDSQGGYYVYPDLSGRVVSKVFETSIMRAYASIQVIGTDALEGYYDNDEVGFGWVSELEARPNTSTPATGKWRIPVHEMYAMPDASQTVLDDAIVNLEQWLQGKITDKFARAENQSFVTGDGTGKPRGFLSYADGTDLTNSIKRIQTGVSGGFAATPNGPDALVDALYDLKAAYMSNATWFMNRATMAAVRKLRDDDGRMVWSDSIAAGQPATLLGYPVAPAFEDMPNIAAGSLSIAVGDMRAAYQIVDREGMRMLRDPYTAKPKVQFYATKRTGGDMINGEALRLIEFAS